MSKVTVAEAFRYSRKIFLKKGAMPEALIFFVTTKCNARCGHCFFWKQLNKIDNELSIDEVGRISSTIGRLSHIYISGGEPFLRQDLVEIIGSFYRNNKLKSVSIPTNGILTEKITADVARICDDNPKLKVIVDFSLDGLGEDHDKLRGQKGVFDNLINTWGKMKSLKESRKNLDLGVICVFNSSNQDKMQEIYKFIKLQMRPDSASFPLIRGEPKSIEYKKVDIRKYASFCKFLEGEKAFNGYGNFPLSGLSNVLNTEVRRNVCKTAALNKYMRPCYAAQLIGTLYSNGDLYACELLSDKIGNLREADYNFRKLWLSEKADSIRRKIVNSRCFCTHECFMQVNLLFNAKSLSRLVLKNFLAKVL